MSHMLTSYLLLYRIMLYDKTISKQNIFQNLKNIYRFSRSAYKKKNTIFLFNNINKM